MISLGRLGGDADYRGSTAVYKPQAEVSPEPLGKVMPSDQAIPVERYLTRDEVLFYDDVVLYEDGHGHGFVKLQVKIRVMHQRFLILLRLFQSRLGSGVRLVDTRYAHEFGESVVISDTEVRCAAHEELAGKLGSTMEADRVYEVVEPCYRVDAKVLVT